MNASPGHRERLRRRFLTDTSELSSDELLELLLTFAIPRQDVAPLAKALLTYFGSLDGVFQASHDELRQVTGVGEATAVLIQLVSHLNLPNLSSQSTTPTIVQSRLFADDVPETPFTSHPPDHPTGSDMRTFTNDLASTALEYLPQVINFKQILDFQQHLEETLPYNSVSSRKRYARNLLNRYYIENNIDCGRWRGMWPLRCQKRVA